MKMGISMFVLLIMCAQNWTFSDVKQRQNLSSAEQYCMQQVSKNVSQTYAHTHTQVRFVLNIKHMCFYSEGTACTLNDICCQAFLAEQVESLVHFVQFII